MLLALPLFVKVALSRDHFPLDCFQKIESIFFFYLLLMQYNCLKSATVLVGQDVISIRDAIGKKNKFTDFGSDSFAMLS